jgi:cytoskeletal protein CcmA (bactofilin family)
MLFNRKSGDRQNPAADAPASSDEGPQRGAEPGSPPIAEPAHQAATDSAPTQSFIDASLTIVGDLHSEGDVQIDGRVCGNVSCAQLIVGRDAAITGTVRAEQAIVRGSITGTIRASVVILQEPARVKSDISYSLLAVDDGAELEGSAHRSENPLAEVEAPSSLADLQRAIAAGSASAAATLANGRAQDADAEPAKPERRNANGHADLPR